MTQEQESRPSAANAETAKNKGGKPSTSLPDVEAVLAALDRLSQALADERGAFEEGFEIGYGDGYQIGYAHGETEANEVWSWALGAIGVGKRDRDPERRAANRWRLYNGLGPAPRRSDR